MRLDDRLNLVIPIARGDSTIYVHATPLSRDVFEAHYLVLSKAFTAMTTEGLSVVAGPRVAALVLKDVAQSSGRWEGPQGVEKTLMNEFVRITNVAMPGENGWESMPLAVALSRELLDADEKAEVIGAIVFFTANSALHRKEVLRMILSSLCDLWGTQTTSSGFTEFVASLPTSTEAANTGVTTPGVSVPS
jgi:hypothetical protein